VIPFDPGTRMQAARVAVYVYFPDGSSALAEGTDLRVDTEWDFGGQMVDVQVTPVELTPRFTESLHLRIYPTYGRGMLRVTKRPPVPGLDEDCPPIP
jgi:hypothetical protein